MKIWIYMNFITDKYNELVYTRMMLVVKQDETNQNREKMVSREEKKNGDKKKEHISYIVEINIWIHYRNKQGQKKTKYNIKGSEKYEKFLVWIKTRIKKRIYEH